VTNDSLSRILAGLDRARPPAKKATSAQTTSRILVEAVLAALHSFTDIVRYLNTRRSSGAILDLSDEAAVQDALYLMLRPWILDLVPENPTDKVANRYTIKDFLSHSNRFVIEAKYIRSAEHGKSIAKYLNDDIETYRYHTSCDDLIFFIYDPDGNIPDAAALERHLKTSRSYDEKVLRCHAVIKP
jgi:hypothetical protein